MSKKEQAKIFLVELGTRHELGYSHVQWRAGCQKAEAITRTVWGRQRRWWCTASNPMLPTLLAGGENAPVDAHQNARGDLGIV